MSVEEFDQTIGKLVKIEGREYMVRSWNMTDGWGVRPLGDVLAQHLLIEGETEVMTLADALVQAGWVAPGRDKDGDIHTVLSREATLA